MSALYHGLIWPKDMACWLSYWDIWTMGICGYGCIHFTCRYFSFYPDTFSMEIVRWDRNAPYAGKGYAAYLVTSLLMQKRMWTLWFLACLFFLNLLFFFAGYFYKERHVVLDKYLDDRRVSPVIFSKWFTIHPLRYIGEHSLLYFAWHQTIVMPLAWTVVSHIQLPFSKTIPWAAYGISLALQTVIILVFLTLCNEMMRRTKLRFMLGKFGDD